jgi:4-hydroxybenzoate polyprenyltransferase
LTSRWGAYLAERFPLLGHGLLIFSFYSSNQFLAHSLTAPGEPMQYDLSSLLGALAVMCVFLQLRIFDDHKDYIEDCRHFPDRVLQRGEVTLRDLKVLLALVVAAEFLLAALRGPGAVVSMLMVMAFSLLMLKEFFAREWLKQRFLLYASTHMLILPLLAIAIFSFATGGSPWQAPGWYWLYSFVGFCVAFNWEISRKIRAPEEEIDGVDTYTKRFGTYGAAYLVLAIRVLDTALVTLVGLHLGLSGWFYAWLVILFAVCMIGFFQFRFWTCPATARRMQTYAGFYIVAFDLALAIELGRKYGLSLSGTVSGTVSGIFP